MRKWILSSFSLMFLLAVFVLPAKAQNGVFQDLTWEEAAALAQKEGKIVLVDAMMKPMNNEMKQAKVLQDRAIFKAKEVVDFVKKNTVAIRIDMGSEAGMAFAPKLVMNMYPTFGFFMPNGDILGTVSPYVLEKDPTALITAGEKALKAAEVKRNNSRSIRFEDLTYEEAVKKAAKENKLVFIDAYTDYCQPCMLMVKNVFSLNSVADYYNEHFINVKLDFGKEKTLANKFNVGGYPAFIFVNGKGKPVYIAGGYTEEKEFIGYGEEALKQAVGIAFEKGTWQEALTKAKKENKMIFMDCYTSWCGPCKMLAKEVFTDPDAAKFFNEKFVNVKFDMEKGEGKMLKDKYGVKAYPTLYFINVAGEVEHCVVGGPDLAGLLKAGQDALEGRGLVAMTRKYEAGERNPEFVVAYMEALEAAYMEKEVEKVCLEYFATLDKAKLSERKYWALFAKYVNDVDAEVFQYVYEHREELYGNIGEKEVRRKIASVWSRGAYEFVKEENGKAVLDEKGFKKYVKRLKKTDVQDQEEIIANAKMANAEKVGDWKTYISLGNEQLKAGRVGDMLLFNWGLRVDQQCKDEVYRKQAAQWFIDAAAVSAKKEAEGTVGMMSYRKFFEELAVSLQNPWKEKKR